MTRNQPAPKAGTRIPRPRRPSPAETPEDNATSAKPDRPTPRKKTKTDIAIEEAAARLAANAPPLSPEQRRRIAELFSTVINTRHS
ncbi:MAG TPA: hypothetical protein DGG94_15680 [Micromonosporaceae bacterium]|nr:hypothetical protein [Micromonosporaceae bacterium]HCU51210.1 hypothetical protein [Micromonosporaceae bacterium]